jgi:HAD superfamily hydrolase (TIGR01549 family)
LRKGSPTSAAKQNQNRYVNNKPALLFDLDGTLVDSVYQHVTAWREALDSKRIRVPTVRIHRSVGMSGRLMLRGIFAEMGIKPAPKMVDSLEELHKKNFAKRLSSIQVLSGAPELLRYLSRSGIRWAIATSGEASAVRKMIRPLGIPTNAPVITGDDVMRAKPHPDVFLLAAGRLGIPLANCTVVGDSVWDLLAAQRAKALGVGLLTGGYSAPELAEAGAFRIFENPAKLLERITEIGVMPE